MAHCIAALWELLWSVKKEGQKAKRTLWVGASVYVLPAEFSAGLSLLKPRFVFR